MAGVLRLPPDLKPGEKRPAVICCQGFSLTKEVWLPTNAKRLVREGYVTLNFDYRHFGESGGEPRCRLIPDAQVQDVRNAITFLETVSEVDASNVGLLGISLGCSVAAAAAGLDPRVKAVVAAAGPADLERVWSNFPDFSKFKAKVDAARREFVATGKVTYIAVPRLLSSDPETVALLVRDAAKFPGWRQEITFESLAELFAFKPEAHAATIRAGLFLYPSEDALIAKGELSSLYAKAREPKSLVALQGFKHHEVYDDGRAFEPLMLEALRFFERHLKNRQPALAT